MIYRLSFALLLTTSMVQNALAVEGGIGRPITGMQVQPTMPSFPLKMAVYLPSRVFIMMGEFQNLKRSRLLVNLVRVQTTRFLITCLMVSSYGTVQINGLSLPLLEFPSNIPISVAQSIIQMRNSQPPKLEMRSFLQFPSTTTSAQ